MEPWEAPVTRVESGLAFSPLRHAAPEARRAAQSPAARRPHPAGHAGRRTGGRVVLTPARAVARRAAVACGAGGGVAGAAGRARGQTAPTGAIRGRLDIRRLATLPQPRPGVGELGGRHPHGVADVRRGLVYLDVAPRSAFDDREPGRAVMDQRNETFMPRLLAVQTGTTVDFPNSDSTYHNVFSLSRARRFDLGRYAAGKSKAVRFDRPGRGARVLRHPFAHVGVRRRLQPSLLPRDRRRRPLPDRQRAARHLHRRRLVRRRGPRRNAASPSPPAPSPTSTWWCRDPRPRLAAQPHLPRQHAAGDGLDRLGRLLRQRRCSPRRPRPSSSAI